jgi:hypothetical protein
MLDPRITPNLDVPASAVARLLSVYERATRVQGTTRAMVGVAQRAELDGYTSLQGIDVTRAQSGQLDWWGAILGEARDGRLDDEYRAALLASVQIRTSHGTVERVREVARLLHLTTQPVRYIEQLPAGFVLELTDWTVDLDAPGVRARISERLDRTRAGGVELSRVTLVEADTFTLDTDGLGLDDGLLADSYT